MIFQPDYTNAVKAARNKKPDRLPLYEHMINFEMMEEILNKKFIGLSAGNDSELTEFYKNVFEFFRLMGYDIIPCEFCICPVLPGGGALGSHKDGCIKTRDDFNKYPWDEVYNIFWKIVTRHLYALKNALPAGMKAIGGIGNGVFEIVQDLVGYIDLCYMRHDDPDLYRDMFIRVGQLQLSIWDKFLKEHTDSYCVLRCGDDLGYKDTTMLSSDDIKTHILPVYAKLVQKVHAAGFPFLLHSCGNLLSVFDDIITMTGIDAKHSNEDIIATFDVWLERFGTRIGNFGGIDDDILCRYDSQYIKEYITALIKKCNEIKEPYNGGYAFSSGNSIPNYIPTSAYITMIETVRELRGDYKN